MDKKKASAKWNVYIYIWCEFYLYRFDVCTELYILNKQYNQKLIVYVALKEQKQLNFVVISYLYVTEDAVFAEPSPVIGSMMAGAVYTLPAQRNVPLPMAMTRLIPMATKGGKPRSFTLPRDSNLHTLLTPPAKEEQQTHNSE